MLKIISLIPARGGSKRLPRKNIKNLNGIPLISYTIKALLKSMVDEVWVSTEDGEIRSISMKQGAKVMKRPIEYALDESSTEVVIEHFIDNKKGDILVICEATHPLLTSKDIDEGIKKYLQSNCDSLVTLINRKLFLWDLNVKEGTANPINFDLKNRPRTQNFDGCYIEDAGLWITSYDAFKKSGYKLSGKIGYHILNHPSIDIDDMIDFKIAEVMIKESSK